MQSIGQLKNDFGKMPLCNRKPNHGFKIGSYFFPLCCRCTGLICGGIIGSLLVLYKILCFENNYFLIILLGTPFVIDAFSQFWFKIESLNIKRILTGILFGIALANYKPF